ncbi:hypothetical protein GDO86_010290 [Hymenochirus boettgeri]|uniref:G-protein coupled receptors family 1 profile domain-containing protein n=1 Tax=Hymenochirus boettgeri TaxID=247094 RepID=A0A8T2JSD1_9PIPI|nr:hypothetical protein GDO86_010290 [Hymenochirus boettgeri]
MNKSHFCNLSDINSVMNSIQLAIYIPTFILGCFLNIFALWIFCFYMKNWTEVVIYMVNLAILDIFLLFSLPFKMYFSQPDLLVDRRLCKFAEALYFTNMYGSIYTITFISLDRYIAIQHPFLAKHLRSTKKAKIVCVLIWVFVWTVSACTFRFHYEDTEGRCFHNMSEQIWSPPVIVSVEIFGFLFPMIIILGCSVQITRTLLAHRMISKQNNGQGTTIRHIVVSNLVVFLLSFSPCHLAILLQFLVRQKVILDCSYQRHVSMFVQVTMCLANVNPCLDALCYYFAVKEFRDKPGHIHSIIHRSISFQQSRSE